MKGSVRKRCTKCTQRSWYGDGAKQCPTCGKTSFSWYYQLVLRR